jgi:hypothetical protein
MSQPAGPVHEATFRISYSQFQLNDYGVVPELGAETDGMVVPLSGGARIACGISDGPIRLRAQACAAEPAPETSPWDEVAETAFDAPVGQVAVVPLFEDPVPGIPPLTSGPGRYRVRVYARGRDIAPHRFVESPTEEYLVQVWPDSPGSEPASR